LLGRERWRSFLQHREGVATTSAYPSPTVREDGRRGANLYRANIACRLLRRRHAPARAHVPVQLIVPDGDRFIPRRYYERAESAAPLLRRRRVPGSHWAPRTQPALIARWVAEWVVQAETDLARAGSDLRS
jgi:pimeloyl-ACP methyl ester carboxylesterase